MKPARKGRFKRWLRHFLRLVLAVLVLFLGVVTYANVTAIWASRGRLFTEVSSLPTTKVGLVFGTTDRVNGRENLYFRYRIDAAVRVWKSGKLETLIVSGHWDHLGRAKPNADRGNRYTDGRREVELPLRRTAGSCASSAPVRTAPKAS